MRKWIAALTTALAIAIAGSGSAPCDVTVVNPAHVGQSATVVDNVQVVPPPAPVATPDLTLSGGLTDSATPSLAPNCPYAAAPVPGAVCPDPVAPTLPIESSWYTRIDYFHWIDRWSVEEGYQDASETGALYTLGYVRRTGSERFRGEFFGGTMDYDDFDGDPVESRSRHVGVRGEYEHLWDLPIGGTSPLTVFAGVGTRVWIRDVADTTTATGLPWIGFQQTWWTIYPYAGLEKKWPIGANQFFVSGRLGATAITYQHIAAPDMPAFYPQPDITGQIECGVRRKWLSISAYFEAMAWQKSPGVHFHGDPNPTLYCSPPSQMFTTGLKVGVWY